MSKAILITGGAGFIGSALVRFLITETNHTVINVDKLTYAANLSALTSVENNKRYTFIQGDICDRPLIERVLQVYQPNYIMHLAAESHVDRSIDNAENFIQSNIVGTYQLLEAVRVYYEQLTANKKMMFRFHHISTDEVYGDLPINADAFDENSRYQPSSPYSSSKAASDHLVKAWHRTYNLPVVISMSSNNYGFYQHTEKLIPSVINKALKGDALPIYGSGKQMRDWLFVDDHIRALYLVVTQGSVGESYNIAANIEKQNIEVVSYICDYLNKQIKNKPKGVYDFNTLITHVADRPGHDVRYALNSDKISHQLGWQPQANFELGMQQTIDWYLQYLNYPL